MNGNPNISADSPSVQSHVKIVQDVITRMADNSRSCKVWCATLVSAVLVLAARTGHPETALLALVPTALFLILDTYYLALERAFRNSYNDFVRRLHSGELAQSCVYKVAPTGMGTGLTVRCVASLSIWPFYLSVTAMVILAWRLAIPSEAPL